MNITRTNLDGTGTQQLQDVTFAGGPQDYIDYAKNVSGEGEGCVVVMGEGFDSEPGRKTVSLVAVSGDIAMDNLTQ